MASNTLLPMNQPQPIRKLQIDELNRPSVEHFRQTQKRPYVLVLDNVRSMNNVGSVFRTADAFCAEKIYLCGITGIPPHKEISKTALGADESVAWQYAPNVVELCQQLQAEGYQVWAVEQASGSTYLPDFEPISNQKYAFVFGNEVFGVNEKLIQIADACLEIPQYGTKHSLNISVSVGVICWDFLSKIATFGH